jgi:uncharacterized membrane protein YqaE (UPF0057 family)
LWYSRDLKAMSRISIVTVLCPPVAVILGHDVWERSTTF